MSVFDYLDAEPGSPPQPRLSDLWEWARDDYLAGEAADVVCERHGVSRSQFFERAKREGWLRRDRPRRSADPAYDAEAEDACIEEALERAPPTAYALYRRAWARAERAILMGRRTEAAGWTRLAKDLRKLALQEENTIYWKSVAKAHEPEAASPPPSTGNETRPDSADLASSGSSSPAKAGAQRTRSAEFGEHAPPPDPPCIWAPACAGEEEDAQPDSPDSLRAPALLNRQDRRRLAKLRRRSAAQPAAALAVS